MVSDAVDQIVKTRDAAVEVLQQAVNRVTLELRIIGPGDRRNRVLSRKAALRKEMQAIRDAATDEVLQLPEVLAAVDDIKRIGDELIARGKELPKATDFVDKTREILGLATQLGDLLTPA